MGREHMRPRRFGDPAFPEQRQIIDPDAEILDMASDGILAEPAEEVGGDYYDVLYIPGGAKIGIGDGGDHEMQRRVRAHANSVEYLPLALLLLGGMELNGYPNSVIHAFGATLLVSRLLHAWGLSRSSGSSPGRFLGTFITLCLMIAMSVFAIVGYVQSLP